MDTSQSPLADGIDLLATNIDRLDYRLRYSESLHRKVGADADIHHYPKMIPFIVGSAVVGAMFALSLRHYILLEK